MRTAGTALAGARPGAGALRPLVGVALLALLLGAGPPVPAPTPTFLAGFPTPEVAIAALALAPDGRLVALGGIVYEDEPVTGRIEVWGLAPAKRRALLKSGSRV